MTKYANPFFTINEAEAVLKSLGANPLSTKSANPSTTPSYPFPWGNSYGVQPNATPWQEDILNVTICRVYEGESHHFRVDVHMDSPGFDELLRLIEQEAVEVPFSEDYRKLQVEPSPLLCIFKLIPIPKEVNECDCGTQS